MNFDDIPIQTRRIGTLVAGLRLNAQFAVIAIEADVNGRRILDIRRYYLSDGLGIAQRWLPTAKGLGLSAAQAATMGTAITRFLKPLAEAR